MPRRIKSRKFNEKNFRDLGSGFVMIEYGRKENL